MPADLLFADSGPLIALARLDLCHLPQRYFSEVQVPQTVWDEVTRQPRDNEGAVFSAALKAGWFTVVADPAEASAPVRAYALDAGEAAALTLALSSGGAILADERKARNAATDLGVAVIGTLGLLKRAREDALVPALRPLIMRLIDGGYFIAPQLVEMVLSQTDEGA
jgi:uncharacterized protein